VVVGPTAAGKTALALQLARRAGSEGDRVEIVSADAMAIYRGMDIGTAKPTSEERTEIPHHLIDVAEPSEEYTVSLFAAQAGEVLAGIEKRGAVPVIVGGTGLYVRALVDGFTIPPQYPDVVARLETESDTGLLYRRLVELDPAAAAKMLPGNRRRIVRALEVTIGSDRPFSSFGPGVDRYPPTPFLQVGLDVDRSILDARIDARYDRQLADGFLAEVWAVAEAGFSRSAGQALGYRELLAHLAGECSLDEALELARRRTRRFARRQQRWFRRDPRIEWFASPSDTLVDEIDSWWRQRGTGAEIVGGSARELRE
jgi:tRNA dimethylallyltransferase